MGEYVPRMRLLAADGLARLHDGVSQVAFLDFPDYANVGDSAIAAGQFEFWRSSGTRVATVRSAPLLDESVFRAEIPVLINGGGNIGGLYPEISEHRAKVFRGLREGIPLLQAPQTVHFVDSSAKSRFKRYFGTREGVRLAVRDQRSLDEVADIVSEAFLAPDPVHLLGALESAPASRPYVVLARQDSESRGLFGSGGIDWLEEPSSMRLYPRLCGAVSRRGLPTNVLRRTVHFWESRAIRRLKRGLALLSVGETVVTDRLHAMLIGLQMGRRVIALDNSYGKLSAYASTWGLTEERSLQIVSSPAEIDGLFADLSTSA